MKLYPRTNRHGVTLIELLIALALMTVLALALNYAFIAGLNIQRLQDARSQDADQAKALESRLTLLLKGAKLTPAGDATSFFLATSQIGTDTDTGLDRLTFTTTAPGIPMSAQLSTDDFETQQKEFGPVGGLTEVSWSTTAIGEAGNKTGLFERLQKPSDADPTQGGMESLLAAQVTKIGFQFYNGTEWVDTWDTVNGQRRLPAAVKVTYSLSKDPPNTQHVLLAALPGSDVDAQNPSTNGQ